MQSAGTAVAAQTPQPAGDAAVVRIELAGEAELAALAVMGLPVYTRLERIDGSLALIAAATPSELRTLARRGYRMTVLAAAPPAPGPPVAGGASSPLLYLLYGPPQSLRAAEARVRLLAVVDRQAVALATEAEIAALAAVGLRSLPLVPEPLPSLPRPADEVAPVAQAALAPDLVYSPVVQRMVNALHQSTLVNYLSLLTGEQPAIINGSPFTLTTRSSLQYQHITKATRFAYEHFTGLGLPTQYNYFNVYNNPEYERRNVIAQQTGLTQPERIFMVTAHLDSVPGGGLTAPGADDNGSGSTAVLAIADILSQYRFGCTLRYVLYTGEEQGLYGSIAYANDVVAWGENVEAVLNLDMLGYNSPSGPDAAPIVELHVPVGKPADLSLANLFIDAIDAYGGGLQPQIIIPGNRFSDHAPFWDRDIPAILAIEDIDDFTPYYHSTNDRLSTLDLSYYTKFVRSALATFAHMGCLVDGGVTGVVTEGGSGSPLANVLVGAWLNGAPTQTLLTSGSGSFWMTLWPATYTVRFSAVDHQSVTYSGVQVNPYGAPTLNPVLQPCTTIKNLTISAGPADPDPGQAVSFQVHVGAGQGPIGYQWLFGDGTSASGAQVLHAYSSAGVYQARVTANNSCDYPVEGVATVLVGVQSIYLPLVGR